MKTNLPHRAAYGRGMTLIELTVVILVLLSLISIMFIGAKAWKRGSDRAGCIMNMRNMQLASRSYQNMYGYVFGGQPQSEYGTQDIARHLLQKDFISQSLYDQSQGSRSCAGGGTYSVAAPSVFPMPGSLYMNCSLSGTEKHAPENVASW
jgi:prepilin-type N-terminal cleavage/methylation domain-containing protein